MTGLAVVLVIWSVWWYVDVCRLDRYLSTNGTIGFTKVTFSRGRNREYFTPVIWYRYSVAGRVYTGDRIWITPSSTNSEKDAHEFIAKMVASTPLPVWYDPDHPDRAVLSKAYDSWTLVCPLTAAAFLILFATGIIALQKMVGKMNTKHPAAHEQAG